MIAIDDGRWHPGIGDPTVIGWVTVVSYTVATVLCARCILREPDDVRRRRFWQALTVAMLLLGINKQLDLQTLFTEIGRDMAMEEGWYGNRRAVQVAFISALACIGIGGQVWLYFTLRGLGGEPRWAGVGLMFLTVFVVMRATSFHHVDALLGTEIGGWIKVNALLENGGIVCIAAAAWRRLQRRSLRAATLRWPR